MAFGGQGAGENMKNLFKKGEPVNVGPVESGKAAEVAFVAAGIKAAQNSRLATRQSVVSDVCQALSCQPNDLEFLFGAANDDDETVYDFPDSERRRMVIRYNNLDAAE